MIAVVAEKPAVARDIAAVLGASKRAEGFLEGGGYVVTWAIGHLVAIAEPHQIDPAWKRWRLDLLPMLPGRFPLVVLPGTRAQFEIVRKVLSRRDVERVVCATDAGREGELIFRYIYEAAGCKKPVERLWISSLTPDAIRDGLRRLRDARGYDGLADAARGRSRADWLVGMNLSRAYSLVFDQDLSVGRVQTPTLSMVVERELAIRRFVPEPYLEVVATFCPLRDDGSGAADASYKGTYFQEKPLPGEPPAAGDVMDPNVAYPPDCNLSSMDLPPGEERHSFEQCAERFTFTMRSAIQEERRLRFEVDIIDKWQSWCAAQTPYGSGWRTATVGDASTTTPNFSCGVPLPAEPSSGVVCSVCKVPEDGAGCPEADIVWVDCETRDLCSKACACTATACSSRSDGQSHLRFDLNVQGNEAHGTSDLGQVHLVRQ